MPGVKFSQEVFDELCDRMAMGEGMPDICNDLHMPHRLTVLRWLREDEAVDGPLRNQYARAREEQMDFMAHRIRVESENERPTETFSVSAKFGATQTKSDNVQRSKLIVDSMKWTMSKTAPKKWGDKLAVEHSGNVQQISDSELDAKLAALTGSKT